jgi:hypothetical protein
VRREGAGRRTRLLGHTPHPTPAVRAAAHHPRLLCCRLLLKLFPTRVKLLPPPAGAVAARHQRRMAADAAEEAEEENYRAAAAVAASTGVRIPPKRAGIYEAGPSGRPLSRADWGKALSWAVAMQTLQERRRQAAAQAQQQAAEAGEEAAGEAAGRANGVHSPPAGRANGVHSPPPGTPADAGLRRRRLRAQQEGRASPALSRRRHAGARPRAALQPLLGALWRAANPLRWAASLAAAAAAVPRAAVALAGSAARCLAYPLYRLPWVGDWLEEAVEGSLDAAQMEAELAELEDEMAALLQAQLGGKHPAELGAGAGAELSADLAQLEGEAQAEAPAGAEAGGGALCLGQDAVRYGLRMAARSSGGVRPGVEPANAYERQLLGEVGWVRGEVVVHAGWVPNAGGGHASRSWQRPLQGGVHPPPCRHSPNARPPPPRFPSSAPVPRGLRARLQRGRGPAGGQAGAARGGAAAAAAPRAVCGWVGAGAGACRTGQPRGHLAGSPGARRNATAARRHGPSSGCAVPTPHASTSPQAPPWPGQARAFCCSGRPALARRWWRARRRPSAAPPSSPSTPRPWPASTLATL